MKNFKLNLAALIAGSALLLTGCSTAPESPSAEAPVASQTAEKPNALDLCLEEMKKPHYEADPGFYIDYAKETCASYEGMFEKGLITEDQFATAGFVEGTPLTTIKPVLSPGDYWFINQYGAKGTFTLPGKLDTKSEKLRKLVDAPALTYLEITIDNRDATETANMFSVQMFDLDGKKYEFKNVTDFYDQWREEYVSIDDSELYNRFVYAHNDAVDFTEIGEKNTYVMAIEGDLPENISIISVYSSGGFESVEASPVPEMDTSN